MATLSTIMQQKYHGLMQHVRTTSTQCIHGIYQAIQGDNQKYVTLYRLFLRQMRILKKLKCPESIISQFENQRDYVVYQALNMQIPNHHIPFIPIIPSAYFGIYGSLFMLSIRGHPVYTCLDPNMLMDENVIPPYPYWIYNIEPGKKTLHQSAEDAKQWIKKHKRQGLTANEGIWFYLYNNKIIMQYNLNFIATKHKGDNAIAYLCLDKGAIALQRSCTSIVHYKHGTPSYTLRA